MRAPLLFPMPCPLLSNSTSLLRASRLGLIVLTLVSSITTVQAQFVTKTTRINPVVKYDIGYDIVSPIHAQHGMVASEQGLATQVGLDMLKRGGNAVDAAVAVGFALAVVLPNAGNIGGGGFMLIHDAKSGRDIALDFREMAPIKASRDMYLDKAGKVIPGKSLYSHLAIGVPGTVAGLTQALSKYGTMRLSDVIAPAIQLAEQGFEVSPHLASILDAEYDHLGAWESSKAIFFKNGKPLVAGEKLIQKDLAASLKLIAKEGASAFYQGAIAKKIVAEMAQHEGIISAEDLKNYKVVEREPVKGNYRGYEIVSMPPPSSGGVHIVQMLHILEHFPIKEQGSNSAQNLHLMAETMKLAYADRSEYLGDPDFVKVPIKALTSRAYADELSKKINPEHATPSDQIKPGKLAPYESDQTTHFATADQYGNVVATTYTLNLNFGSGIVASGTGITLNNEMDDFSVKAGAPNAFGLLGGDANAIAAYKRPLSSMSPTIILKDGQPFLTTGSPGGSRIITTSLQIIMNVIDHDMNVAEASIAPRIHHQWMPDQLRVEKGISIDTLNILEQKGQHLKLSPTMGRTQTIQMSNQGFDGYSDPRNPDGKTLGY
ncbi:gamma-glutamyltransferase [Undibacterium sp. RTI2.1]|uniref:gamma-glutamyltransferase n=1 Tax=unclassified Undibacterium TaxID=2630295 RepID=UPI002AB3710D|nr:MULTISPECIES: gamma-glutamyltransferase [unclassified Undibacterium]MDY7540283.1 gamma-glutamyltransferase [Undibacterium sp. 5I1]MEB0031145.1 gamma-glutamyltransferase [Undibacterium sp. RTI2.1]MEB0115264.1 gamma-glutamyltransferase [Undibacterium sp. RTI2.2]MEB0232546.1 gamma-glutamyltransferase [Undibacterium sp. 10I3]MEB0259416.1 gamma-glutamyltransferase [Undibacterium sp. 5I1]